MSNIHSVVSNVPELFDQRKFDAFLNCEPLDQSTFEEKMRLGPLPKVYTRITMRTNAY
jgi:N-terminal acetyltransferase B complex non-catalytic subunit